MEKITNCDNCKISLECIENEVAVFGKNLSFYTIDLTINNKETGHEDVIFKNNKICSQECLIAFFKQNTLHVTATKENKIKALKEMVEELESK